MELEFECARSVWFLQSLTKSSLSNEMLKSWAFISIILL